MGRSVNYLNNAIFKTFFDVSLDTDENGKITGFDDEGNEIKVNPNEWDYQLNWDDFFDSVNYTFNKILGLDYVTKRWEGKEVRIISENRFFEVGVSEYCGLASVSIRVNEKYSEYKYHESITKAYLEYLEPEILKALDENVCFNRLNRIGGFSNGEGVYQKAK